MTVRKLTEQQMHWSEFLSKFNFTIGYQPGKLNVLADALSWREQDMPDEANDEHLEAQKTVLIKEDIVEKKSFLDSIKMSPMDTAEPDNATEEDQPQDKQTPLEMLWDNARDND